jgi:hypothetical protein
MVARHVVAISGDDASAISFVDQEFPEGFRIAHPAGEPDTTADNGNGLPFFFNGSRVRPDDGLGRRSAFLQAIYMYHTVGLRLNMMMMAVPIGHGVICSHWTGAVNRASQLLETVPGELSGNIYNKTLHLQGEAAAAAAAAANK